MSLFKLTVSTLALSAAAVGAAQARDEIRIVGSSTVFPYTQAVAEQFANVTGAPSPIVESTGTGGGMKIFCAGIGEAHPDLTGASRAMKASEYQLCQNNGVTDITEAMIGYDGLSIAISRAAENDWDLTLEQVFLALAAEIPGEGGWIANPNKTWADVDASLPAVEILAYGPPPTSGTRDAFVELAMHAGCEATPFMKALKEADKAGYKATVKDNCSRMRQDGPFVEAGENDNLIVQRLNADEHAMGIFGYSFLYENMDTLKAVRIAGVEPSAETIGDFSYPISRPLYFYTKNAHRGVIPNFQEFIEEYMSDDAMEPGGYLSERGMVALPDDLRAETQDAVIDGKTMAPKE
ncbi:phosphate ABC transporter substrate-binding protein, PhoT family [Roseovarius lutimaris]|uniref:Phosphate ABC transporter substrate-binding protein, PhoT family n=1 Tax=Roseovarius lutimaris TaxID=1005928 RepID=A0A1I4YIR6_9RHOB|nr:substrate-binding domain-containing protein [Roseovarius lutimaris]SFN37887.1 phosphate ABC transporter substrate-binding protein, PhoT family [Roseovarius lutimaris]